MHDMHGDALTMCVYIYNYNTYLDNLTAPVNHIFYVHSYDCLKGCVHGWCLSTSVTTSTGNGKSYVY